MGLSLLFIYILWASFGHIGPSFSSDVLNLQQSTLRAQYHLPEEPIITDPTVLQTPPSLRQFLTDNATRVVRPMQLVVQPMQLAVVRPMQLAVVRPMQLAVVRPMQLAVVRPMQLAVVRPMQLAVVRPMQLAVVRPMQLAVVRPMQLAVVRPMQLAVVRPMQLIKLQIMLKYQ